MDIVLSAASKNSKKIFQKSLQSNVSNDIIIKLVYNYIYFFCSRRNGGQSPKEEVIS